MKIGTVIGVLVVVAAVIAVGYAAFKPHTTQAPAPSPAAQFKDESGDNVSDLGQFVQQQPQDAPPGSTTAPESTATTSADAVKDETSQGVTIDMDEQGFHPSQVTVAAGTTVTFVNNGQAQHWPASDVHPTHQQLPGFDAKHGLETGETYSYTFTKVGTWTMHDHLNPQFTGAVTVQ